MRKTPQASRKVCIGIDMKLVCQWEVPGGKKTKASMPNDVYKKPAILLEARMLNV